MQTEQHTAKKPMVTEAMREKIKKFLESSENENATY
jgi:hypothetical protein